jgi:hypothetical protein
MIAHKWLSNEESMGTWSHESFGNDDACDWAGDLVEHDDLGLITSTLDAVLVAGNDYVEAPAASQAVAAAEAVARLQGRFGLQDAYSRSLDEWVARVNLAPSPELARKAHAVLDRIVAEPSELLELWEDSEESASWIEAIKSLRARIHV